MIYHCTKACAALHDTAFKTMQPFGPPIGWEEVETKVKSLLKWAAVMPNGKVCGAFPLSLGTCPAPPYIACLLHVLPSPVLS